MQAVIPMVEWKVSETPVSYPDALFIMEERVDAIRAGDAEELVWLLEHPPLYTAGTSARESDLIEKRFPVYEAGRGGQYTYHGPGQRVAYVMLDLKKRYPETPDLRDFVNRLENWIILTLSDFGIIGAVREGRIGVWVQTPEGEKKIAALGIRVRGGVTFHGIAVNINPDLSHYSGIVPCGIQEYGVTSLAEMGKNITFPKFDASLRKQFQICFE